MLGGSQRQTVAWRSLAHRSDRHHQRNDRDGDQVFRQQDRRGLAVKLKAKSLPPISTLRSLWRAATIVSLPKKSILNLSVDAMEPLLCALGSLPVRRHFGLKLGNPIFGRPKLVRKPLRRIDCMSAVLLSDIRSFIEELKDRLTGFVDLSVVVGRALSRSRKWNHFGTHY